MPTIRCPGCQTRYKVTESAAGMRTRCKKCGQAFRIPKFSQPPAAPPHAPTATPATPSPAAGDLEFDAVMNLAQGDVIQTGPPAEAIPVHTAVDYAPGARGAAAVGAQGAYRGYLVALARSCAMIFTSGGNLAAFLIILGVLFMGEVVGFAFLCCLSIVGQFIITGWYMSFLLNTVVGAAGGEDDLPTLTLSEGWMEDIVAPFFKMFFAYALTRVVAASVLVTSEMQAGAPPEEVVLRAVSFVFGNYELLLNLADPKSQVLCAVALAIGMLLLPMFILVVAIGGFGALLRVDLMLMTIVRSFPAYLIAAVISYAAEGVSIGLSVASILAKAEVIDSGFEMSPLMLAPIGLIIAGLYVRIVQMRAIGLYYHHFKHRFAWAWD